MHLLRPFNGEGVPVRSTTECCRGFGRGVSLIARSSPLGQRVHRAVGLMAPLSDGRTDPRDGGWRDGEVQGRRGGRLRGGVRARGACGEEK